MSGQTITIEATDASGAFSAYLARPASGGGPAIVAIQEIFGVNDGMRQICDRLAGDGFFALCPDLFWRQAPGIELTDKTQDEWSRAFALMQGFDVDTGMADIQATIDVARGLEGATGKVGAVGYCLGGKLAYLAATRTDVDASVGYYGVGIQDLLGEAGRIRKPLMLHIAQADEYVDAAAQAKIHAALDAHALVTLHDYPAMNHAFARPGGVHHDAAAAAKADARTLAFFRKHLA